MLLWFPQVVYLVFSRQTRPYLSRMRALWGRSARQGEEAVMLFILGLAIGSWLNAKYNEGR